MLDDFHWQGRKAAVPRPGSEAQNKIDAETARQQPAAEYWETRYNLPPELDTEIAGHSYSYVGRNKVVLKGVFSSRPDLKIPGQCMEVIRPWMKSVSI